MFKRLYEEDNIYGDLTTELLVPRGTEAEAKIIAQEPCVVAGAQYLVSEVQELALEAWAVEDGTLLEKGDVAMRISGDAHKILSAERTILNILSRMSGIATETRKVVDSLKAVNPQVRVAATRKTLWGKLDKLAVIAGGGDPHRWNLSDLVLVKDNHIALVGFENVFSRLSRVSFTKKVEVEVETEKEALMAARQNVDIIMLDNFTPEEVCKVAEKIKKISNVMIEVSGGITPDNAKEYAKCNIDIISMGYLTHSSRSVNFSMSVQGIKKV